MDDPALYVVRVFNNNAVLVRAGNTERVVVGRGIGFGRKVGDYIAADNMARHYVEMNPDRMRFLDSIHMVNPAMLETISTAVDLAGDLLGDLHPSVYLLLVDHLVFAVQRRDEGQIIRNTLAGEIKAVFPAEYAAAELVLNYVNSHIDTALPIDEAAFIALHLNAARTGATVKQPLEIANELAGIISDIGAVLDRPDIASTDHELPTHLARVMNLLRTGAYRRNDAARSIERDLPREAELARHIICRIMRWEQVPREVEGEVAYLAVFLHGWHNTRKDNT